MPAPKRPNTARATEVAAKLARRRNLEAMAVKLRAAGWTVTPPEDWETTDPRNTDPKEGTP